MPVGGGCLCCIRCSHTVLTWLCFILPPPESSLLHDNVEFVLCLDTLANGDELHMHVSRPPRADTPLHAFIQQLEEVISRGTCCYTWFCVDTSGVVPRWWPPGSPG